MVTLVLNWRVIQRLQHFYLSKNQTLAIKSAGSCFTDCIVTPQYCLSAAKLAKLTVPSYQQHPNQQATKYENENFVINITA
jgi:hypothetical protein